MKLLNCHIENFGKLHNYNYVFNPSFNEIIEENGWGKTTFSVFIKAMFYGLPAVRFQKINDNERKKYKPWQGGNYGGSIEFEIKGEQYRIERFFGEKESLDVFNLYDLKTGKISNKYTSNIGLEIFELDAEGYERSTYIPQKEIVSGINDKISAKLINMIQGTNNSESYENATSIIKARMSALSKKGNSGLIADYNERIATCLEEIDFLKRNAENLEVIKQKNIKLNTEIEELETQKLEISEKIKKYSKNLEAETQQKQLNDLQDRLNKLSQEAQQQLDLLNNKEVDLDELKRYQDKEILKLSLQNQLDLTKTDIFNSNSIFEKQPTSIEEIDLFIKKQSKVNQLKSDLTSLSEIKTQSRSIKNKNLGFLSLMFSLIIASLVVGFVFMGKNMTIGILSLSLSVVFAFTFIICLVNKKTQTKHKLLQQFQKEADIQLTREKSTNVQVLQKEVDDFIKKYSETNNEDPIEFLYNLKSKYLLYLNQLQMIQAEQGRINQIKLQINALNNEIDSYLSQFDIDKTIISNQEKFEIIRTAYNNLQREMGEIQIINQSINEMAKLDEGIDYINYGNIDDLQNSQILIQRQLDERRDIKTQTIKQLEDVKNNLNNLTEYEEEYSQLKIERDKLKEEFKVLSLANKFLEQSNDNLSAKYLLPMKTSLNKYLSMIIDDKQTLNLDTNLTISFESFGSSREIDYLSKGLQGVVDLCIRFSLINVLFDKEKPFIILDDPFVNMDKIKIENALNFLKLISSEYQIIYFVCHEARA